MRSTVLLAKTNLTFGDVSHENTNRCYSVDAKGVPPITLIELLLTLTVMTIQCNNNLELKKIHLFFV